MCSSFKDNPNLLKKIGSCTIGTQLFHETKPPALLAHDSLKIIRRHFCPARAQRYAFRVRWRSKFLKRPRQLPGPFLFSGLDSDHDAGIPSLDREAVARYAVPTWPDFRARAERSHPMIARAHCGCAICRMERYLTHELGDDRSWKKHLLAADSANVFLTFGRPLEVVEALHSPSDSSDSSYADRILVAILKENVQSQPGSLWQTLILL